ncbi:MAG: peroxiredoxin [Phycisphaerales bacterium]|nr:peroxiredoxin [Phycisphaerales bacterium]
MLRPGQPAPAFSLPDQHGVTVTLASLVSRGPQVLFFYPADFTPICTAEACYYRDAASELASLGARIVGISGDPPESHRRFEGEHSLGLTLLSDPSGEIARAYRAIGLFGILPFGRRRVTYLVGTDGLIKDAVAQELGISRHQDFVRRTVRTLHDSHHAGPQT